MKRRILSAILVTLVTGLLAGFNYVDYNRYEAKKKTLTLELGDALSLSPEDYLTANPTAIKNSTVDSSGVDEKKVGEYSAIIKYGEKSITVQVKIIDTKAPEIILQTESAQQIIGSSVPLATYVKDITDLAGIKTVSLSEGQTALESADSNIISTIGVQFNTAGEKNIIVTAEDINGNKTEKELIINVVEDYAAHVQGIQDITVEQNSQIDWMAGITSDDKIKEVSVDAAAIDLGTPGIYQLKYTIIGDDEKTKVEKTVNVTVVAPEQAQEMANSGAAVKTTGGTKSAASGGGTSGGNGSNSNRGSGSSGGNSRPSGGAGSSNSGSSGGHQSGSNSSSGSGSSGSNSGMKPGDKWEGNITGSGTTPGGIDSEEGTWNPWE